MLQDTLTNILGDVATVTENADFSATVTINYDRDDVVKKTFVDFETASEWIYNRGFIY